MESEFFDSDSFEERYGFRHECRCGADVAEGNLELVPRCYLGMADDAMEKLRSSRNYLRAVAEAEHITNSDILRTIASEGLKGDSL